MTERESTPAGRRGPHAGIDGVTHEDRTRVPGESTSLQELERRLQPEQPDQLALFAAGPGGALVPTQPVEGSGEAAGVADLPPLHAASSLSLARDRYREELERARRPANTIHSYLYDLAKLEQLIGAKAIETITRRDIARYLGDAGNRSTRKRRLTSARRFFAWLIGTEGVLKEDPTSGYYPHGIALRAPVPLFADEEERLLVAATADAPWSLPAIWLMLRLGLTRAELLALSRDHIDRSTEPGPTVYIVYPQAARSGKERHLITTAEFGTIYRDYLETHDPGEALFPIGPQAVNGMVERVRRAAAIDKDVSPNVLRHTFAVARAREGADQSTLLALLGLADDPRNRLSVNRYLDLAAPPVNAVAELEEPISPDDAVAPEPDPAAPNDRPEGTA